MNKQKSFKGTKETGTLYLVPTPIGNLEDMTFRAVKTLKSVDLIASEDTRNTQKLLNHFDIQVTQKSLHEYNYKERVPQLVEQLLLGESIAQVSDAGMPSISDPGHELVLACIEKKIPVVSLPGPTAGMTALIASGLLPQPFLFYGFLPRKKKEQTSSLADLKQQDCTLIFYESPYRVAATLKNMQEVFGGQRNAVICRELTKIHEEYLRGTIDELIMYLEEAELKGECCLLVSGNDGSESKDSVPEGSLKEQVEQKIQKGLSSKAAIKEVAVENGIKKQEVYRLYHGLEE